MSRQFSGTAPGGPVSGRKRVRRQAQGLILEYDLESSAGTAVRVLLADRVPTERAEEFGFHEEHEPGEWTLSDGDLEMGVTLEPGAERTVVLGLVAPGAEPADVPADPSIEVEPLASGDEAAEAAAAGGFFDRGKQSLLDEDDGGVDDRGSEDGPADPVDADAHEDGGEQPAANAGAPPRVDADGGVVDPDREAAGVVSALVDELEAGTVSESELDALREHLGGGRAESEAVKLEYVQKRLGDFDAYVDALEDLLAVHGSGDDAITEIEGRLDGVADDVAAVRQRQDELADRVDDLADALETQSETVESLQVAHEEDVAAVREEVRDHGETVREEVEALRRSVDADLAALEAEVRALEAVRRTLVDGLSRPEDGAAGVADVDTEPDEGGGTGTAPTVDPSGRGDRNVEESLETAEAAHFSTSSEQGESDGEAADGGAADEADGGAADEADDTTAGGDGADPADGEGAPGTDPEPAISLEASDDDAGSQAGTSDEDRPGDADDRSADARSDDGFVSAVRDGGPAAGGAAGDGRVSVESEAVDANPDADSSSEADSPGAADLLGPDREGPGLDVSDEGGGVGAEDDLDVEDGAPDADPGERGDEADDTGDGEGRASSIFEIGDVDSGAGDDDETPTIDFEDH